MLITRGGQTCRERLVNLKKKKKKKVRLTKSMCSTPADWSLLESSSAHHPANAQPHRQVCSGAHSLLLPRWQPCKEITGGRRQVFSSPWSALSAVLVRKPILVNSDKDEKLDTYQFPWPLNMHTMGQYRPRSILALAFFFFFF